MKLTKGPLVENETRPLLDLDGLHLDGLGRVRRNPNADTLVDIDPIDDLIVGDAEIGQNVRVAHEAGLSDPRAKLFKIFDRESRGSGVLNPLQDVRRGRKSALECLGNLQVNTTDRAPAHAVPVMCIEEISANIHDSAGNPLDGDIQTDGSTVEDDPKRISIRDLVSQQETSAVECLEVIESRLGRHDEVLTTKGKGSFPYPS